MSRSLSSPSLRTRYLILYNAVSAVLWLSVLGRVTLLIPLVGPSNIYGGVGQFAKWTQTLAMAELLHSLFGLVHAPFLTTLMQISSRILLVWGIVFPFPTRITSSPFYASMLFAWSLTEVVRYGYFAINLAWGGVPGFLVWLRYNTFFLLYPLGITSEVRLILLCLPEAYSSSPSYYYLLITVLCVYVPGSYILYTHMMRQRRKVIKGKSTARRPDTHPAA